MTLTENQEKFVSYMMPILNEKQRRYFLGAVSDLLGYGSVSQLSRLTGMARGTITDGAKNYMIDICPDPKAKNKIDELGRTRGEGAGRKKVEEKYPTIEKDLLELLNGCTAGDPQSLLQWTTKSLENLADALQEKGYKVGRDTVARLLHQNGFSLQQNQKFIGTSKGGPDRDAQFRFINGLADEFLKNGQPVISVDTKKKELVGNFKNAGKEYCPVGEPIEVSDHEFPDPKQEVKKVAPYGVYDTGRNEGYVSIGISSDTGMFAANSIRNWWYAIGCEHYADTEAILITCDGGGSNGSRNRLWKKGLQSLADEIQKDIRVCHFPPGTSKWNKIEHRMFSFITMNWRARPLQSIEIIVDLISHTTTKTGLKISCSVDHNLYETGLKVTDEELAEFNIIYNKWHGEWNYLIRPHSRQGIDPHADEAPYMKPVIPEDSEQNEEQADQQEGENAENGDDA